VEEPGVNFDRDEEPYAIDGDGTPEERLAALEEGYRRLARRFEWFEQVIWRFGRRMIFAGCVLGAFVVLGLAANYKLLNRINDDARANDQATCKRGNEFRDLNRTSLEDTLKALIPDQAAQQRALAAAKPALDKISASKRDCSIASKSQDGP
jgi:hypothetical protein